MLQVKRERCRAQSIQVVVITSDSREPVISMWAHDSSCLSFPPFILQKHPEGALGRSQASCTELWPFDLTCSSDTEQALDSQGFFFI